MERLHYFGTNLSSAGHFFFEIDEYGLGRSRMRFEDCPFNPEALPYLAPGSKYMLQNGTVQYHQFCGYSILAIAGSCIDKRPSSKSIFFMYKDLTHDELRNLIMSSHGKKIIEAMPFEVKWLEYKV